MIFASAIQSLRGGDAAKRESWLGYVFKRYAKDSTAESPKYDLVFKNKDGSESVYPFDTGTAEVPLGLPKMMLVGFMSDDWIRGRIDAFEKARTGGDF